MNTIITLLRLLSGGLSAVALSLAFCPEASAGTCGSIEFPSCGACGATFYAAQGLPHGLGCEACAAICRSRPDANPPAPEAAHRGDGARRVTEANFVEADPATLAQLARANPMAALAIDAYSPRNEARAGSFRRGRMAFPAMPTLKTFAVATQAAAASAPVDYAMAPLSVARAHAELSWTSRVLPSGDLEVTFRSEEAGTGDIVVRALYPSVRVVLANSQPAKLLEWQLVK